MVHGLESSSRSSVSFGGWWGEKRASCACHAVCSCKHYVVNRRLVAMRSRAGLDQARGRLSGSSGRPVLLCLPDPVLGRGYAGLSGAFLSVPVLRPSTPGSATVTHVGAGFMLLLRGLWQLLQLWGGSLTSLPH